MAEMRVTIDGTYPPGTAIPVSGSFTPGGTQDVNLTELNGVALTTTVPVSGTVTATPSGTQAVSGTVTANAGTGTFNVSVLGTSTSPSTTLTAASATGPGTAVDFGSAASQTTLVVTAGAGVTAGVVELQLSQDGTNWVAHTPTLTFTAPGSQATTSAESVWRHARANITTAITGGTVSATIMAWG